MAVSENFCSQSEDEREAAKNKEKAHKTKRERAYHEKERRELSDSKKVPPSVPNSPLPSPPLTSAQLTPVRGPFAITKD